MTPRSKQPIGAGVYFFFQQHDKIGAIQPKILLEDGSRMNNGGLAVQYLGFAWDKYYQAAASSVNATEDLAAFSGAAVLVKKEALLEAGYFDEKYFMYHEDVDLSLRLRLAGYTIQLQPELVVRHHYSYKRDPRRYFFLERNRLATILKNYPVRTLILIFPAWLFMEIGMIYFSLTNKWFLRKLQAYIVTLVHLPSIIATRQKIKRKITAQKFFEPIIGPVTFTELDNPLLKWIANPILTGYWQIVKKLL